MHLSRHPYLFASIPPESHHEVFSQAVLSQAARPQPYSPGRVDLERVHPRCPALGADRPADEPLTIPDPEPEKPENWDDEKTGGSTAPTVPNQIPNHKVG